MTQIGSARGGFSAGRVLVLAGAALSGCGILFPSPDRVPTAAAAAEERQSCGADLHLDRRLIAPSLVQRVEPLVSVTRSSNNEDFHLQGALLHVYALPGVTQQWLERSLRCFQARAVLGKLPAQRDGADRAPYWLPGGWVTIGVQSDGGSFTVSLRGDDIQQSRLIFERAKAFAALAPAR